jgi:hypothetical protein
MMSFQDCFPESYEYPDPTAIDVTQSGWRLDYISSTFLDGWINYVTVVRAFVVSRYAEDFGDVKAKLVAWVADPPSHTKLRALGDDVLVLAQDKQGRHWFFHFDCDVSDCSIGVADPTAGGLRRIDVPEAFTAYAQAFAKDYGVEYGGTAEAVEILPTLIRGWVSW